MKKCLILIVLAILAVAGMAAAQTANMPCIKTSYGYYCKVGEYQIKYEYNAARTRGIIDISAPEALIMIGDGGITVNYGHYELAR